MNTPMCCGEKTEKRIFTASLGIKVDFPADAAYVSPASGKVIASSAERKRDFSETGTRPWEGIENERKEAQLRKSNELARQDAELTKTAESAWQNAPEAQKKAILGALA
jgi:hypothetical protein